MLSVVVLVLALGPSRIVTVAPLTGCPGHRLVTSPLSENVDGAGGVVEVGEELPPPHAVRLTSNAIGVIRRTATVGMVWPLPVMWALRKC